MRIAFVMTNSMLGESLGIQCVLSVRCGCMTMALAHHVGAHPIASRTIAKPIASRSHHAG
jgi:hypothetical protein